MTELTSRIHLVSGGTFDPLDPDPDLINIEDIAHALSLQCRYNGHTRKFYSVAEHSVRASMITEKDGAYISLWTLLHDAPEAYIGDLASPLKNDPAFGQRFRGAEDRLMRAVCQRFGLNAAQPRGVKAADMIMLTTEVRDLMPKDPEGIWNAWLGDYPRLHEKIEPWTPAKSKKKFLERFVKLMKKLKEE